MTKRKYTKVKERPKCEFDLRVEAFHADLFAMSLEYGLMRAECLKRHSSPPYFDEDFLVMIANSWTHQAILIAQRNPGAARAYLNEHKD